MVIGAVTFFLDAASNFKNYKARILGVVSPQYGQRVMNPPGCQKAALHGVTHEAAATRARYPALRAPSPPVAAANRGLLIDRRMHRRGPGTASSKPRIVRAADDMETARQQAKIGATMSRRSPR
jgi:hypothetical protein